MESQARAPEPCRACGTCPTCGRGGPRDVFDWTWRPPYYGPYWYDPVQWWQQPIVSSGTSPNPVYATSLTN